MRKIILGLLPLLLIPVGFAFAYVTDDYIMGGQIGFGGILLAPLLTLLLWKPRKKNAPDPL